MRARIASGSSVIQLVTGSASRQKPIGARSATARARRGVAAAISQATIAPNECPTNTALSSPSASNSSS